MLDLEFGMLAPEELLHSSAFLSSTAPQIPACTHSPASHLRPSFNKLRSDVHAHMSIETILLKILMDVLLMKAADQISVFILPDLPAASTPHFQTLFFQGLTVPLIFSYLTGYSFSVSFAGSSSLETPVRH